MLKKRSDFTDINATGGTFTDITANGGIFNNVSVSGIINATSGSFNNCNFVDVSIKGRSYFEGDIISGPLKLTSEHTAASIIYYNDFSASKHSNGLFGPYIGTWKGISFSYISVYSHKASHEVIEHGNHESIRDYQATCVVSLLDMNRNVIRRFSDSGWGDAGIGFNPPLACQLIDSNQNSKTFKLLDLPTVKPAGEGYVWNNNGTLCVT